ncbi:MAG: trypsin-like serine protease [Proteobacteria bacterium]|nr:trypsin-like serine protease [Pseudomonadota bacterium]
MPVQDVPAEVGSEVLVVGSPGGEMLSHSVTKGIVSGYRDVDGKTALQTDATINAGNSGGPVVGPDGNLLGIVSYKVVGQGIEGLGFAVAATDICPLLNIRWHTDSDTIQSAIVLPVASNLPALSPGEVKVTLPPGVFVDTTRSYRLSYQPRVKSLAWGIAGLVLGGALVGSTVSTYVKNPEMTRARWSFLQVANTAGWTLALGGGAGISFSLALAKEPKLKWEEQ